MKRCYHQNCECEGEFGVKIFLGSERMYLELPMCKQHKYTQEKVEAYLDMRWDSFADSCRMNGKEIPVREEKVKYEFIPYREIEETFEIIDRSIRNAKIAWLN